MNSEEKLFFDILRGRFDNIPKARSRVVRIFLSSTFTDTHAERDYLIEHIYPKLKKYCKNQYGLDFQVLDMRWGISDEATNNHMATRICINEIKNSQKASIGPNFVGLLSHRYGNRDLPTTILAEEFKTLKDEMINNPDIKISYSHESSIWTVKIDDILDYCYQVDENETPFRYRLKNINKLIPDFQQKNPDFVEAWETIQVKLSTVFRAAADSCYRKEQITETQKNKYFVSITEKEVFNGVIQAVGAADNAVMFIRDIEGIDKDPSIINNDPKLACRFIELDSNNQIDNDAKKLLDELKYERVKNALPAANIHRFQVQWDSKAGISKQTHIGYLAEFGKVFFESVRQLIDRNALKPHFLDNLQAKDRKLLQEVLDHANFCNESVEKFHGREDLLGQLVEYVAKKTDHPFVVYGESGCGKTSVIAKFAHELLRLVPDPENYVIILRFLGTTPGTSNIMAVYQSLIHQLSRIFNTELPEQRLNTKNDMRDYLNHQLLNLSHSHPNKKIVIMLDSIDQLSTADYNIEWMITELPVNVKMIYSTLPDHGGIFAQLKGLRDFDDSCFTKVTSLTKTIVVTILNDWLSKSKRSLSESQWQVLDTVFTHATLLPLYVKLIFDVIVKWTSFYTPNNEFKKCLNIDKSIEYLFRIMEKNHGKMLFSRAMFYMSTFKNGISENELEDILSIDDDVLYEIFEYHAPPVRRFPAALWARIKHDLSEYMVEKEADETQVIYWYHRRFIEVTNALYISKLKETEREIVFSNVIDFFNETWKDKPKPYKFNKRIMKKRNLDSETDEASRNTTTQPTEFVGEDGVIRYNKRKLTELPAFISRLTANLASPLSCKHIYFNYEFIHGLFVCSNYVEILENLQKVSKAQSYQLSEEATRSNRELRFLAYLYLQCLLSMNDYPDSLAIQIVSRVVMFYGHLKHFSEFIEQCDKISPKHCALVAPYQSMPPPGTGPLFTLEKHTYPINCCVIGGDGSAYVFTLSNKFHAFNMASVKSQGELKLPALNEPDEYKFMVVSFATKMTDKSINLKLIDGSAVIMSDHLLYSVNFDSTVNFTKTFENTRISKLFQLTTNHVLVFCEGNKYFEVYNMYSGDVVITKSFDTPIKFIESNLPKERLMEPNSFDNVKIAVVLTNSEIQLFNLPGKKSLTDRKANEIQIDLVQALPPTGLQCVDCVSFIGKGDNGKSASISFCLSFIDGSYGIFSVIKADSFLVQTDFTKPDIAQTILKLVDTKDGQTLFLGEDKCLYLKLHDGFFKVDGTYNNGLLAGGSICAISKGLIDMYKYHNAKVFKLLLILRIDAHFMEITRVFFTEPLIFTASKDGIVKIFHLNNLASSTQLKFKLDRSQNDVDRVFNIDLMHSGTYTGDSPLVNIWNVSTGKIVHTLNTGLDFIYDIEFKNCICSVIGILNNQNKKSIVLQSYVMGENGLMTEASELFTLRETVHASFLHSKLDSTFIVLSKTADQQNPVKIDALKCHQGKWSQSTINNLNNAIHISLTDLENVSNFNNVAMADDNQTLAVYYKDELFFVDASDGTLLVRKNLKETASGLNYFKQSQSLSEGKRQYFCPVEDRCDFVAINSTNHLVYIDFTRETKTVQLYASSHLDVHFSRIQVFKHILCAYSDASHVLYMYDLKQLTRKDLFKSYLFKKEFEGAKFRFACVSDHCEYLATVHDPKMLSLFRISTGKRIAYVALYTEVNFLQLNDNFVVAGMQDKRIYSLLIADPLKPDHHERIQALESRNYKKNITRKQKKMNDIIINNVKDAFDGKSKDQVFDNKLFEEDKASEIEDSSEEEDGINKQESQIKVAMYDDAKKKVDRERKKIRNAYKKSIKVLDCIQIYQFYKLGPEDKQNEADWLATLYAKKSFLTKKEIDILMSKQSQASQLPTHQTDVDLEREKKTKMDKNNEKDLLQSLIEIENEKFQNTNHNVAISNSLKTSSKACNLM